MHIATDYLQIFTRIHCIEELTSFYAVMFSQCTILLFTEKQSSENSAKKSNHHVVIAQHVTNRPKLPEL